MNLQDINQIDRSFLVNKLHDYELKTLRDINQINRNFLVIFKVYINIQYSIFMHIICMTMN